jgi:transposase-like protein
MMLRVSCGLSSSSFRLAWSARAAIALTAGCSVAIDYFPTYRCRKCQRTYTILTGSVFEKTRQRPATIVLLLRGIAKGESTTRLSRELHIDRKHLGELRQQIQTNLYDTLPGELMTGTACLCR